MSILIATGTQVYGWSLFSSAPTPVPHVTQRPITIMLDPAGDARYPGRTIEDSFERGITLNCAQELKHRLEEQSADSRVILTRFPGETVDTLQNAAFANRLQVDFYLSLHFYKSTTPVPKLSLYYMPPSSTAKADDFHEYYTAHTAAQPFTQRIATELFELCQKNQKVYRIECQGPFNMPCKPLVGITAPALMIEIGLVHKDDWTTLLPLLVEGLKHVIVMVRPAS